MSEKPPAVDQDGKMINPHNPEFITKVPWYLGNQGPTLKHHSIQKDNHELSISETDRLVADFAATKKRSRETQPRQQFRKGSCKNCGAITHSEKDCLERPRSTKTSAWKSGITVAADDLILDMEQHGKLSYAAKRDNWQGYDPAEHVDVIRRHDRIEQERLAQENRTVDAQNDLHNDNPDSDSDSEHINKHKKNGEFVSRDEDARDFQGKFVPQGGIGGAGMRVTVRNLRIREDTPKYLRNYSLDSAFYDPKSRSMRDNPYPNSNPEEVPFAGDNFLRYSGDALKLSQNQVLCWEMQARGESIDVISNPSQAELLHKLQSDKQKVHLDAKRQALLSKYGDDSAPSSKLDPRLLLGQSERYVNYDKMNDRPQTNTITKYVEDEYPLNHTSVWGSYYDRASACWGYHCCRSNLKNSYCVGGGK